MTYATGVNVDCEIQQHTKVIWIALSGNILVIVAVLMVYVKLVAEYIEDERAGRGSPNCFASACYWRMPIDMK